MKGPTRRAAGVLVAAVLLSAPGCAPDGVGASVTSSGEEDTRYRMAVELGAREPVDGALPLHIVVEPRAGWHLAPEAPASLRLDAPRGVTVEPREQRGEAALRRTDAVLEFASAVGGAPAGSLRVTGRLKFGICEGDDEMCAIVRRDLDLTLHLARP